MSSHHDLGPHAVYASVFTVRASEPLAGELANCLADLRAAEGVGPSAHNLEVTSTAGKWTVEWDGERRYSGPFAHLALYDALIAINEHTAETAVESGCVVLHGGAVAVAGRGVAFVGHSGAGKSTLTADMSRRGHQYIADEVVAVQDPHRPDGGDLVLPFHRPVGLRPLGAEALDMALPDGPYETIFPYRIGLHGSLGGPTPLRLILLLRRSDVDATIKSVSPAQALFELSNQTLGGADVKRQMFRRLEAIVRRVSVAELHYRSVGEAISVVEAAVATACALDGTAGPHPTVGNNEQ